MARKTPEWKLTRARALRAEGLGWKEIAERLGCNMTALHEAVKRREYRGDDAFAKEAAP